MTIQLPLTVLVSGGCASVSTPHWTAVLGSTTGPSAVSTGPRRGPSEKDAPRDVEALQVAAVVPARSQAWVTALEKGGGFGG